MAVERVLGSAALAEYSQALVPLDWSAITRGRDLFVAGWGGFDIDAAHRAFLVAASTATGIDAIPIPSVEALRSYGYLAKFFSSVLEPMQRERLRRSLLVPHTALAQYVVRHCAFFRDPAKANRLDEVSEYFDSLAGTFTYAEKPNVLLNRLARERAVMAGRAVRFHHLSGLFPRIRLLGSLVNDHSGTTSRVGTDQSFELEMLEDSRSIVRAAHELNNCAANYVAEVRQKRCALIVLRRQGKILAMGEWDLKARRWSQISEHNDEPVRTEWQRMFDEVVPMLPLPQAHLAVPRGRDHEADTVSIFSPEAAKALVPLCRRKTPSDTLLVDWPDADKACVELHPEAAGALLLWAVAKVKELDVLRLLLERAAEVDTMTNGGWTSLMLAIDTDQKEIAHFLLESAADLNVRSADTGRTALMLAVASDRADLARSLIERAADLNVVDRCSGKTALVLAVEQSHLDIVGLLMERRAVLDVKRYDGKTPLMLAAKGGHTELACSLVQAGAKLDTRNDDGCTAMLEAAMSGDWKTVVALVEFAANIEERHFQNGKSALMLASMAGHQQAVECLLTRRAILDACSGCGETPLIMAAVADQWHIVQLLAERRADLETMDKDGGSALVLAAKTGNMAMVDLLADLGASRRAALCWAAAAGRLAALRAGDGRPVGGPRCKPPRRALLGSRCRTPRRAARPCEEACGRWS